jgi:hypothetical protein
VTGVAELWQASVKVVALQNGISRSLKLSATQETMHNGLAVSLENMRKIKTLLMTATP